MSIYRSGLSYSGSRTSGRRNQGANYQRRSEPKNQLGINRNIEDYPTKRALLTARNTLRLRGAPKRLTRIKLHVVEGDEILDAVLPSGLLQLLGPEKFMQAVEAETAPVVSATRTVKTTGLHQYGESIGVGLEYPRFMDARIFLTSTIDRLTGQNHEWEEKSPRIILGIGDLSQLAEEASRVIVPSHITLARTAFGPIV